MLAQYFCKAVCNECFMRHMEYLLRRIHKKMNKFVTALCSRVALITIYLPWLVTQVRDRTNMNKGHKIFLNILLAGVAALAVVVILSWKATESPLNRYEIEGHAQGTTYHITYYAADSAITKLQADSLFKDLDKSVSLYLPESLICRFNRSEKGVMTDRHFEVLIRKAMEINLATMGAVDVTVKPLVDAWGFGLKKPASAPDSGVVKALLQDVGGDKIWFESQENDLEARFLHKRNRRVQIDLNGIAQGYSADLLAALLERRKVSNYLVEIGGELRVKGHKSDGQRFRIGIEGIDDDPLAPSVLRKVIIPDDGAVTTSGNYRKFLENEGKRISHLMDARTGYPIENELVSITVWAKDGITADGFDNGFMAMGLENTLHFLEKRTDMGAYIIYKKNNGTVADTVTNAFKKYDIH